MSSGSSHRRWDTSFGNSRPQNDWYSEYDHRLLPHRPQDERLRTPVLGGQRQQCDRCGHEHIQWHSCRNRLAPDAVPRPNPAEDPAAARARARETVQAAEESAARSAPGSRTSGNGTAENQHPHHGSGERETTDRSARTPKGKRRRGRPRTKRRRQPRLSPTPSGPSPGRRRPWSRSEFAGSRP